MAMKQTQLTVEYREDMRRAPSIAGRILIASDHSAVYSRPIYRLVFSPGTRVTRVPARCVTTRFQIYYPVPKNA